MHIKNRKVSLKLLPMMQAISGI